MPTRKKATMMGALEGDIAKLQADEESSSLAIEKQERAILEAQIAQLRKEKEEDRATLEAQVAQLQKEKEEDRATLEAQVAQLKKEKEDMKTQLDQLRSGKEAAENNFNLGEAEGKVNELQMCKLARNCTRPFDAQLLPAIPDEVTLDHICTKLPWSTFQCLSSVSRCWREAIQSRRVYDARVHAQATETLVCYAGRRDEVWNQVSSIEDMEDMDDMEDEAMISLPSSIEKSFYKLPQIPNLDTRSSGLPIGCQCLSSDGKIYVLGGTYHTFRQESEICGSAEVYVLDMAGQRPWKQVASMHEARLDFAACVTDGRIYVFGGRSLDRPVYGCEVYDLEIDKWSQIMPMTSLRFQHKVAVHGKELVIFEGENYFRVNEADDEVAEYKYDAPRASDFDVYDPTRDEWRGDEWRVTENPDLALINNNIPTFTANGKSYLIDWRGIYSLDNDDGFSWTMERENSFPTLNWWYFVDVAVAVNDEILAIASVISISNGVRFDNGISLFQSIGFNGEDKKTGPGGSAKRMTWQKLNCSLPLEEMLDYGTVLPIQL